MSQDEIKRWIASRRAAARREREELSRTAPLPEDSIRQALALIALVGRQLGWPLPDDPVGRAEDELAWDTWARLRERLRS
ncbi:MAG: hypothetical protein JXR96_09915 [Deltaproteobacteria bacterium]|nr:hypothetical protein [Deltaproteobacteria bacterium]